MSTTRYRYIRVAARGRQEVIVDIDDDGREDWAEQYPGEFRWYPCVPTQADRVLVAKWQGANQTVSPPSSVMP